MTVRELIDTLSRIHPDTEVQVFVDEPMPIESVTVEEDDEGDCVLIEVEK
jgi:hypothetical protein